MTTVSKTLTNLGTIISKARKKEKMTQNDLAKIIGVSRLTISNIENGKNVTMDTFLKIFKYFFLLESLDNHFAEILSDLNSEKINLNLYE